VPDLDVVRRQMAAARLPGELLASVQEFPQDEVDALLWMVIFHLHTVYLRAPMSGITQPVPLTDRGTAMVIAEAWPDPEDERADYTYWYRKYALNTPYESIDDVRPEHLERVLELRDRLRGEPRVADVRLAP
jgi:hypothetical protein